MFNNVDLTVKVKVDELLGILKNNREKHHKEFQVAEAGYRVEVVKQLRRRARLIQAGKLDDRRAQWLGFQIPTPVDYTDAYDQVIGMLEMAQEEQIELTSKNYKAWVQDQWEWKAVAASNSMYTLQGLK